MQNVQQDNHELQKLVATLAAVIVRKEERSMLPGLLRARSRVRVLLLRLVQWLAHFAAFCGWH